MIASTMSMFLQLVVAGFGGLVSCGLYCTMGQVIAGGRHIDVKDMLLSCATNSRGVVFK